MTNAAFTPDTCSPEPGYKLYRLVSICIACRRLHVSCICVKIVVNAALRRRVSTCIRIQVARPGYLYLATWCKRGLSDIFS